MPARARAWLTHCLAPLEATVPVLGWCNRVHWAHTRPRPVCIVLHNARPASPALTAHSLACQSPRRCAMLASTAAAVPTSSGQGGAVCPVGYLCPAGSTAGATAYPCPAGTYTPLSGAQSVSDCGGKYRARTTQPAARPSPRAVTASTNACGTVGASARSVWTPSAAVGPGLVTITLPDPADAAYSSGGQGGLFLATGEVVHVPHV